MIFGVLQLAQSPANTASLSYCTVTKALRLNLRTFNTEKNNLYNKHPQQLLHTLQHTHFVLQRIS